jgi:hypothetical protein
MDWGLRSIVNRQFLSPLDYPKDGVGEGRIPGGARVGGGEGRGVYPSGVGVGNGRYGSLVRPVPVTVTGPELWQERIAMSAATTPAARSPERLRTPRVWVRESPDHPIADHPILPTLNSQLLSNHGHANAFVS